MLASSPASALLHRGIGVSVDEAASPASKRQPDGPAALGYPRSTPTEPPGPTPTATPHGPWPPSPPTTARPHTLPERPNSAYSSSIRATVKPHRDRPNMGVEVAVENRAGLTGRSRSPRPRRYGGPALQQHRHRRTRPTDTIGPDPRHERSQLALSLGFGAPHRLGAVTATPGLRVDAGIDPQLPRPRRPLPHRTSHDQPVREIHPSC